MNYYSYLHCERLRGNRHRSCAAHHSDSTDIYNSHHNLLAFFGSLNSDALKEVGDSRRRLVELDVGELHAVLKDKKFRR